MTSVELLQAWPVGSAVLAFVMMTTVVLQSYIHFRAKKNARYPPMAPISMWETIQALSGHDTPFFLRRMALQLGTSAYRLPLPALGTPMVAVVNDVHLSREILMDKDTVKPLSIYSTIDDANNGVKCMFTTNGSFWHSRRKGIAPAFSSKHVQRMNAVALAKTDEWIDQVLRPLIAEGKSFNVGDEMINLLLQAISETAFEYTMSPEEISTFKHELELNMKEFVQKSNHNPFRKTVFGNLLPERRRAKVSAQRLQDHGLKMIQSYHNLKKPVEGTIINLVMTNPCYQNDKERAADLAVLMIGGHDTTAYTLAWTLKELAQHSEIQSQLRQSIQTAQQKGEDPSQLELVRIVIREAIRLHPVSAGGPVRTLGRDFVTKEGALMPAGSIVLLPIITLHQDPAIFGKDWDQFKPDRWDKANVTNEMNLAFLPFSAGRQNCVGQPLANAELHCILPRIISQFEVTVDQPGTTEHALTLKPVNTMLKARAV